MPREKPIDDYSPPDNLRVIYKPGATFDSGVICDYLDEDVREFIEINNLGNYKATMFLDSAPCHLTNEVSDKF